MGVFWCALCLCLTGDHPVLLFFPCGSENKNRNNQVFFQRSKSLPFGFLPFEAPPCTQKKGVQKWQPLGEIFAFCVLGQSKNFVQGLPFLHFAFWDKAKISPRGCHFCTPFAARKREIPDGILVASCWDKAKISPSSCHFCTPFVLLLGTR